MTQQRLNKTQDLNTNKDRGEEQVKRGRSSGEGSKQDMDWWVKHEEAGMNKQKNKTGVAQRDRCEHQKQAGKRQI